MSKMNITVVGLGLRKTGANDRGSYDFIPVAFTYENRFIQGVKAATANLQLSQDEDIPVLGQSYMAFVREDYEKRQVFLDGII